VRATLDFATSKLTFDPVKDVLALYGLEPPGMPCYDTYTSTYKPYIGIKSPNQYVLLAYPGACSRVFKIIIGDPNANFKDATVTRLAPYANPSQYIASVAFDHQSEILWIASKTFELSNVTLQSLNTKTVMLTPFQHDFHYDYTPILTMASDSAAVGPVRHQLVLAAAGSGRVYKYLAAPDGSSLTLTSMAYLAPQFDQVGSTFYKAPYFYFSTFEPNAKLVRIHNVNFCAASLKDCGDNAFCKAGVCACWDGFYADSTGACQPGYVRDVERQVAAETGATAALAVLLVLAIVAAIIGWFLWWRARKMTYSSL